MAPHRSDYRTPGPTASPPPPRSPGGLRVVTILAAIAGASAWAVAAVLLHSDVWEARFVAYVFCFTGAASWALAAWAWTRSGRSR